MSFRYQICSAFVACWIILPVAIARGQQTAEALAPAKEDFHLFLLVGQSNMAGRGKVEASDRKPHPRVLMLTKDLKWGLDLENRLEPETTFSFAVKNFAPNRTASLDVEVRNFCFLSPCSRQLRN